MSPLFGKKTTKKEEKSKQEVVESKKDVDIKDTNLSNLNLIHICNHISLKKQMIYLLKINTFS